MVHAACPEVEECIKWNCPFFVYRGPVCAVAAFKAHCRIGFWKADVLRKGPAAALASLERVTQVSQFPSRVALKKNARARKTWDAFTPSHARDLFRQVIALASRELQSQENVTVMQWLHPVTAPTPTGFTGQRRDGGELPVMYDYAVGRTLPEIRAGSRLRLIDAQPAEGGSAVEVRPWSELYVL